MSDAVPDPTIEEEPGRHADRSGSPDRSRWSRRPGSSGSSDRPAHAAEPGGLEDGAEPTFPHKPFLRTGYDRGAVDEFVTKVVLAVHDESQTTVSADDVAGARFPGRRFGPGYRMREVDDYLGAVEALLRRRTAARGVGPEPASEHPEHAHHHHEHHPTWWIYGVALLLVVVIIVFTVTQI